MKYKFGDILINGYASENNPHRKGVFVRYHTNAIQMTDMKGNFWCTDIKNDKLELCGTILPIQNNDGI